MWESIVEGWNKLLDRPALLLLLLGTLLFIFGATRGIQFNALLPLTDDVGRYSALGAGALLFLIGIYLVRNNPEAGGGGNYGITITSPRPNAQVDRVDVTGEIKRQPPDGYKLMILRIHPDSQGGFVPLKEVKFIDKKRWVAEQCDIGGKTGDARALGVYLVGKSGQALFGYFRDAADVHNPMKIELEAFSKREQKFLPLIKEKTTDMIEGAEVAVKRK